MTTRRDALSDDQWARIQDRLPGQEGYVGVTAQDNRLQKRFVSQAGGRSLNRRNCTSRHML
ncbi:MAG: hypothetical protein KME45_12525 [Stenomitos rutilans HA7619-LM2]|nr:hypothetical protein [Stenomitos rutilans HA7619-LM2]